MSTVSAINSLPTVNAEAELDPNFGTDGGQGPFTKLPVLNAANPITANNLVTIQKRQVISPLSFTVATDNPSLVTASVNGGALTFAYPSSGATGMAHITVTADDSLDGSSISQTFTTFVGATPITIGSGGAKAVRFSDATGKPQTISLSGPGSANVFFSGTGLAVTADARTHLTTVAGANISIAKLTTTGTTARSTLRLSSPRGGNVTFADVSCDSTLGSLIAPSAGLTHSLTINGSINQLKLASVARRHDQRYREHRGRHSDARPSQCDLRRCCAGPRGCPAEHCRRVHQSGSDHRIGNHYQRRRLRHCRVHDRPIQRSVDHTDKRRQAVWPGLRIRLHPRQAGHLPADGSICTDSLAMRSWPVNSRSRNYHWQGLTLSCGLCDTKRRRGQLAQWFFRTHATKSPRMDVSS